MHFSISKIEGTKFAAAGAQPQVPVAPELPKPIDEHIDCQLEREEHGEGDVELIEEAAPGADLTRKLRVQHVEDEVLRRKKSDSVDEKFGALKRTADSLRPGADCAWPARTPMIMNAKNRCTGSELKTLPTRT